MRKFLIILALLWPLLLQAQFPTTGLLDQFNRADENPLANGNWTGPFVTTAQQMKIVTNVAALAATSFNLNGSIWNTSTFGPNSECYFTLTTDDDSSRTFFCILRGQDINALADGYLCEGDSGFGDDNFRLQRVDNAVRTQIGSTQAGEWASGDALGCEMTGNSLQGYRKPSGGSWATHGAAATDSTYTGANYIGFGAENTGFRFDDFGGGTISAGAAFPAAILNNPLMY